MSIKPNNLLFLCYLWWLICLIKFTKHQSCLLHLLSYYEAFKWSFSHSSIFQTTQDICPQTSKKIVFCYLWTFISPLFLFWSFCAIFWVKYLQECLINILEISYACCTFKVLANSVFYNLAAIKQRKIFGFKL